MKIIATSAITEDMFKEMECSNQFDGFRNNLN